MFQHLQIPNPRERLLVGLADVALRPLGWRRPAHQTRPSRVLLFRLERIGDLLMTLDAMALVRSLSGDAEIALVVGSWNRTLAELIPGLSAVHTIDVPWLAREAPGDSWPVLIRKARALGAGRHDLAINFEPDIRSNVLTWLAGAGRRVGYWTGGGGSLLTDAHRYLPDRHVRENADMLVRAAFDVSGSAGQIAPARLQVTETLRQRAAAVLASAHGPLIGLHAAGGRASKQWHPERFGEAVDRLASACDATVVLTGTEGDRAVIDAAAARLGSRPVIDVSGQLDLPTLAAVLERLDLLVTGDTGPMHLAAAVGTPVVALFGPSDPRRYGPVGSPHEVLRVQLPCSPCGLVRLPPERCRNRVPECLDGVTVDAVVDAGTRLLGQRLPRRAI